MVNFLSQTMPDAGNMLVDFSPIGNALDSNRKNALLNRESSRQDEELQFRKQANARSESRLDKQDARQRLEHAAKAAFAIQNMPDDDPVKQQAWGQYLKQYGDGDHSPEEMDFRSGPKLAAAMAGQYLDPRESQLTDLKLQRERAEIGRINREGDASKVVEVNGRLVRVGPQGAQEIYNSGPDKMALSKGAPNGYMWKDPNNPAAGVDTIPGFDKPIPGDVAGKIAMMNMAQQGIAKSRSILERDWGAGDVAQYGAANVPLVGDLGFLSGEMGMAQRDIRTGIEATLRTMTGAAAPESEVVRYMHQFMPNIKDSKQSAKQKIDNLMKFMTDANQLVLRGRGDVQGMSQQPQTEPPLMPALPQSAQSVAAPKSEQEYMALPPGTPYVDPEGNRRTKQ